jgi:hypothetical protein
VQASQQQRRRRRLGRVELVALAALCAASSAGPLQPALVLTPQGTRPLRDLALGILAREAAWRPGAGGLEWTEIGVRAHGEGVRTLVIAVRLAPEQFHLSLENGMAPGGFIHVWTVDQAPPDAALAFNAGQFAADGAWGWVVHRGHEYRAPRSGPLAAAVVIDSAGLVSLLEDTVIARLRREPDPGRVQEAFQSFPVMLRNGMVPRLLAEGQGVDIVHRDARLALGLDQAGRVVVLMTRFDGLGSALGAVPFGLTVLESAELLRGLGCREAVALDGGISAQLRLRDAAGVAHVWKGLRPVPLGFSAIPRQASALLTVR